MISLLEDIRKYDGDDDDDDDDDDDIYRQSMIIISLRLTSCG